MKRLFEAATGLFFDNKEKAKGYAAAHNSGPVKLGPDHWRYGLKGNPKTHSHNARSGGPGNGFPKKARRFN